MKLSLSVLSFVVLFSSLIRTAADDIDICDYDVALFIKTKKDCEKLFQGQRKLCEDYVSTCVAEEDEEEEVIGDPEEDAEDVHDLPDEEDAEEVGEDPK